MATINAVIVPAKALKGGRHKIRISVAHNGEVRYILTDIVIDSEKEFRNGQVTKRPDAAYLNTRLRGLMQKCQMSIDSLEYTDGLTCSELVSLIKDADKSRHRTLKSIYEEYISQARIKPSSLDAYTPMYKSIANCLGPNTVIDNISNISVIRLESSMRKQNLSQTTIRQRMSLFRSLVNYAKRCGYVQFRTDPFNSYRLPNAEIRQAWLSVDQIRAIRDYAPQSRSEAFVRDLFMLSYYLGGINMVDLVNIDFNRQRTHIKYVRTKTETRQKVNKFVEFDIPKEAQEIVERRKGADGRIAMRDTSRRNKCKALINHSIHKIGEALGIPYLIFYSARKSFSQHAFQLGVAPTVIDYILGHRVDSGGSSLYHYISVTPEQATQAVRLVLDNLR